VAVSWARRRFFVIGSYAEWSGVPNLSVLAQRLRTACEVPGWTWLTVVSGVAGLVFLRRFLLSGGFGSGDREGVVGEICDELQLTAECLDVAGDGFDG